MYVSKQAMMDWLSNFDVEVARSIGVRLNANEEHISYLNGRLKLAERVIGELYLMVQETEE